MAIVFSYVASTNICTVTGGTSGTPATFADFVTADRAGTGTSLKAATAASKTFTLTYPVRPVEFRAIVVKLIVASKTTETDYLFITGTDAWGAAQTENIDVSAGNGTYTSTKRWRTISNISCSDATDGTGTVWADGTLAVTQDIWGVIWNLGNSQYQIDCTLNFGDASTATYFKSIKEQVYFGVYYFQVKANATLQIGEYTNSNPINGSCWRHVGYTGNFLINGGTTLIYGSLIECSPVGSYKAWGWWGNAATATVIGTRFTSTTNTTNFYSFTTGLTVLDVRLNGMYASINAIPISISDFKISNANWGAVIGVTTTISNLTFGAGIPDVLILTQGTCTVTFIDTTYQPTYGTLTVRNDNAGGVILEKYTMNIEVGDSFGTILSGVVVDCEDQFGTPLWTAGTVTTDVLGRITQQVGTYNQWSGTSETLTCYSPHKFTLSKSGYQTLVIDNIYLTSKINWHFELQPAGTANMQRVRVGH